MKKYDIVIIDSGVDNNHNVLGGEYIEGFSVSELHGKIDINDDFYDNLGHGTAIYSIIKRKANGASILNIKINNVHSLNELPLVLCLEYIKDNIQCKIINISMGIRECYCPNRLYSICLELSKMGVLIISALDNEGYISFPAAFDCVIGVDSAYLNNDVNYEYIEGSVINIRWRKQRQKLPWATSKYIISDGTSFSCAQVTAFIYELSLKEVITTIDNLKIVLKKYANRVLQFPRYSTLYPNNFFKIYHAAVFPFNKEVHIMANFPELLSFNIVDFFDINKSGHVGVSVKVLTNRGGCGENRKIKNIKDINWDSIDCLILGHCDELNNVAGDDIRRKLVINALDKGINIFSFDPLNEYIELFQNYPNSKIHWPSINSFDIPNENLNRLYSINKPVVGIFGTSSRQGKFTTLLVLKQLFENNEYSVGCIGTEPNSLLMGLEFVFPFGYNSCINVNDHEIIKLINKYLYSLCKKGSDIIFASGQANSIPFTYGNVDYYPVRQHSFILGLQPDALILCINEYDTQEYILNTIKYLEGSSAAKVISIVLYPLTYQEKWIESWGAKIHMDEESLSKKCNEILQLTQIPCFVLGNVDTMHGLYKIIIDYL